MPQLDVLTFESSSFVTFFAFIIGLTFDANPHDEFFIEEFEFHDLTSKNTTKLSLLVLTPLDQFIDICAGLPVLDGDFINLIPALAILSLIGGDDLSFSEKESA